MKYGDHRDRGPALLLPTRASTSAASARAFFQDVTHKGAVQGGSTITQQFVKNALAAQTNRTVFQKLREAALAYHLDAQVVEGEDPHRVPEHDLLRQRRVRHRVGGAHVLRTGRIRAAARRPTRCAKQLRPG